MSEFRRGQNPDLEEDEQNAEFEARSFEPKISDEDPDNKVEVPEPEPSVEVVNENQPNVEAGQEFASLSEAAALEQIKSKYGDGDWIKNYDTSGEYRFNKVARVMEQETEAGEIKNITQTIQGEKYISLHQESLQAWSDGEIHLMESEKITDNGVVLEVFAQWVEDDGRIRSVSWSREVVAPELPTVEDRSDDEGGDEDNLMSSADEAVPGDIAIVTKESTAVAEVVIEMGADWEDGDEVDGGFDEEDDNVSSVQGFGFQTQSAKPIENAVAQAASLRSVDTSPIKSVEFTNFHEAAGVLDGAVVSSELAKDIEVVASEQKDAGELAPGSKVDQADSVVENINLFGEPAITVESANITATFETAEATTESDSFTEVTVVEETVAKPAFAETRDVVIDMDGLWGEVEARDESYQVGNELNIAEQSNDVVSEQIVAVREYATASEAIVESVKQVESVIVEQAETVAEQADINSANEQITSAEPAEVFVQPVEVAAQSTEAVQETGSVIQMFEYQKENSFKLNQEKDVELSSPEQNSDAAAEQIISTVEEFQAVESVEGVIMQEVTAETPATETATIINLADYWEKGVNVKNDNKLNVVEQSAAASFEQKIPISEPLAVVESVQFVAKSEPAKAITVEQNVFEPVVAQAANVINMATYWQQDNTSPEIVSAVGSDAVLSVSNERSNTLNGSYTPALVADEIFETWAEGSVAEEERLVRQAA